jgi:hypothetical protein
MIRVQCSYSIENLAGSVYAAGESVSAFQTSSLENPERTSGAGTADALAPFLLGCEKTVNPLSLGLVEELE